MRVELKVELDIPDSATAKNAEELLQRVSDGFVNFASIQHAVAQSKLLTKAENRQCEDDPTIQELVRWHETWNDILSSAKLSLVGHPMVAEEAYANAA